MPSLWDKLNDFQALVAKIQERSPNPKDKQLLGEMLQHIKASQTLAQEKLNSLLDDIQNQAEEFKLKFEVAKQELAQATQKAEALQKQAAEREALEKQLLLPKVKTMPAVVIDPELGKQLRDELLAKLPAKRPAAREAAPVDPGSVKEEIFDADGGKTRKAAVADEWPEELRTPTKPSKKPADDRARQRPPQPQADDESIGKSWGADDDL